MTAKIKARIFGKEHEFAEGTSLLDAAKTLFPGKERNFLAARVNCELKDMPSKIGNGDEIEFLDFESKEGKEVLRHSSSHLLCEAVKELFPDAKAAIGPAVENGFYYDFEVKQPFTPEDLEKIETKMSEHAKASERFERKEVSRKEALEIFNDNPYKIEMINELPEGEKISIYTSGTLIDLCKGPHVPSTSYLKAAKLLKVGSSYWRGDQKNKSLQRIYGISFPDKEKLKAYLDGIEEAKKRNHLKIGRELDLFSMHDESPGVPFFHGKGMAVWNSLMSFWRKEHLKRGYLEISTPVILKKELWVKSGHWDHYKENMYFTKIDEEDYAVKPMNCPGAILVYRTKRRSYRELPLRFAEPGIVHRHELSGVLNGLFRVRKFTQDDAHIFCTEEQIESEVNGIIDFVDYVYKEIFGFDYSVELSTMPDKAMGSFETWDKATNALKKAIESKGMNYKINEGDGAFYGPKIDFHIKDSIGRNWQCGTVQLDFLMPQNFDLAYIGKDDKVLRPVMLHRVIFGSLERFIGILIEHYAGKFPLWLNPAQAIVFPISETTNDYAAEIHAMLIDVGIRSELDLRSETVSAKVRDAQLQKASYIIAVGGREAESNTVSARNREGKQEVMGKKEFVEKMLAEIREFK